MPNNSRPTSNKRSREKAQQERQKEKERRRLEAKERKTSSPSSFNDAGGEDPDIAGIRPGPQARPDWLIELDAEAEAKETEEA